MRILFLAVLYISGVFKVNAQKSINLILLLDDRIVTGNVSSLKLIGHYGGGRIQSFTADYYPGNLSVSDETFKQISDTSLKNIYLYFDYTEEQHGNSKKNVYNIDLKKGWLTHYYYILYIYNTTKSKYKNMFVKSGSEGYVYEFEYPGGGTKLVRRKNK